MDRNSICPTRSRPTGVALRKESVDRNIGASYGRTAKIVSLSARRAWIEIAVKHFTGRNIYVALRKESVDRNPQSAKILCNLLVSLSARRAWIEIVSKSALMVFNAGRSPQGERG